MNKLPLDRFLNLLAPKRGERILDMGCGKAGDSIAAICENATVQKIYGLDVSEGALKAADKKLSKWVARGQVELMKWDLSKKIPFPNGFFDAIYSFDLLES